VAAPGTALLDAVDTAKRQTRIGFVQRDLIADITAAAGSRPPATLLVVDDGGYSFPCPDVSTTPLTFEFTMGCATTIRSRWTDSMHGWRTIFAGPVGCQKSGLGR